jgi:hypothetical protein
MHKAERLENLHFYNPAFGLAERWHFVPMVDSEAPVSWG